MAQPSRSRVRYPARAIAAVAAAALLFTFNLITGFLFMAMVPPFIPVYISVLLGGVCLLRTALEYAVRVSIRVPAGMLPVGKHEQDTARRSLPARAA